VLVVMREDDLQHTVALGERRWSGTVVDHRDNRRCTKVLTCGFLLPLTRERRTPTNFEPESGAEEVAAVDAEAGGGQLAGAAVAPIIGGLRPVHLASETATMRCSGTRTIGQSARFHGAKMRHTRLAPASTSARIDDQADGAQGVLRPMAGRRTAGLAAPAGREPGGVSVAVQLGPSLVGAASGVHRQRGGKSQMWPPALAQASRSVRQ
jgi:hypothetical protein